MLKVSDRLEAEWPLPKFLHGHLQVGDDVIDSKVKH